MSAGERRPNVLFLVSEDCPPRFGCYGDPLADTPNIDRLAAEGMLFRNAYSSAPVCAPSRFGMISGIYPQACGPAHQMAATAHLPARLATYPQLLRGAGYYCSNNAKTHYNADIVASEIWDDSSRTAHWRNRPDGAPFLATFNLDLTHESSIFEHEELLVDPAEVRVPSYLPDTADIRADIASYYTTIHRMDGELGELVDQLTEDGLLEETVIVHSSDHGGVFPRSKRFCYDEGLRVPLIVRAPAWVGWEWARPGTRIDTAVCTVDLPATFVALARVPVPADSQGRSLADVLSRDAATTVAFGGRNRMDERIDMIRTVRDARYRYLRNYAPHRPYGQHQAYAWLARGYRSWETEWLRGSLNDVQARFWRTKPAVELYDTQADPDETINLAGLPEYAGVEDRLRSALLDQMIAVNDNGFIPESTSAEGYDESRDPDRYDLPATIALADLAIEREPAHVPLLVEELAGPDPVRRYWAAQGLLMLGTVAPTARAALRTALEDGERTVAVTAAEILAQGDDEDDVAAAIAVLKACARPDTAFAVRLAALNALTCLPVRLAELARAEVEAAAVDAQEYIRGAGRYLLLRLDGSYTPESTVFAMELVDFSDSER